MNQMIERYNAHDRTNHWAIALLFLLAALSGLALFHPSLYWLTHLFGGGPWARILHPYMGVLMFLFFTAMALRFWHHNQMTAHDRQWLKQWRDVVNNREDRLPEVGRYNAGQKLLFKLMVVCVIVLLLTGIVFWRGWPHFAGNFSIGTIRLATLLHAIAAYALIIGIIVHIYAAIWVKGTIRAMTRGYVSHIWARRHHAGWYKEITRQS